MILNKDLLIVQEDLGKIRDRFMRIAVLVGLNPFDAKVIAGEIFTNPIVHGDGRINLQLMRVKRCITFRVSNPTSVEK